MPIKIAVLKEIAEGERRVAIDPSVAERLDKLGASISIQTQAGTASGFPDEKYEKAQIAASIKDTLQNADITLKVQPPTLAEVDDIPDGTL